MKKKILLLLGVIASKILVLGQFTSGVAPLGTTGMTVKLDTSPTQVTLTLTGDTTSSFLGIGFGNSGMALGADGFIFNKSSTTSANLDYTFGGVGITPLADVLQDWTITSSSGIGTSSTTIVATRSLTGSLGDTPVANSAGTIDIFFARGPSSVSVPLAYHGSANRGYTTLSMSTLGTTDSELKKITISPNPTNGIVNFQNGDKIKSLTVYDSTGRLLLKPKLDSNNTIDISYLKSGIYYIEIENNDGQKTYQKLMKE